MLSAKAIPRRFFQARVGQLLYASSFVATSRTRAHFSSGSSPSSDVSKPAPDLNPPRSSFAPELALPNKDEYSFAIRYYLAVGKSYFKFYKAGLSAVRANRRLLWERFRVVANPPFNSALGTRLLTLRKPNRKLVNDEQISRADWIMWQRVRHDSVRLPAFGVLFAIFWELTPLVVLVFRDIVPLTCRLPSQLERERKALQSRRKSSFERFSRTTASSDLPDSHTYDGRFYILRTFNLIGKVWEQPAVAPLLGVMLSLLWKVRGKPHVAFLRTDDDMLRRSGPSLSLLSTEELRAACDMRGIDSAGGNEGELRALLERWLAHTNVENELEYARVAWVIASGRDDML